MTFAGKPSSGRHILIIEDPKGRRTICLEEGKYSLGRQRGNEILLHSKQASRRHATLVRKSSTQGNRYAYWILDGDLEGNRSHNGIYVNGEKCLVHELKDGDLINFGCEVNASYHFLSSIVDSPVESSQTFSSQEKYDPLATARRNLQSDLMISEPHLTVSSDDTLQDKAYIDPLTELPNRRLFHEYLSIAIGNAKRNQKPLGILFFDLEQFRGINDRVGSDTGEKILKQFGQELKKCLRSADIVGRWGGDEFAVLVPQMNTAEDMPKIIQRLLHSLEKPFEVENQKIELTVNVGLAIYPQDGNDGLTLLKKAERSLGKNKQKTKHLTRLPKTAIGTQTSKLSKVENLLTQALAKKEFSLCYQPEVNVKTGEITAIEALLRWQHPQFGSISPSQFIPLAEKTDLIVPLSKWIIETVCRQSLAWHKQGFTSFPISVNLSPKQLQQPELLNTLTEIVLVTGIDPQLLIIEVTETTLMEDAEIAFRRIHEFKQMGVNIALDDFGVGYTSVAHLQQFPFSKIKIAQSLVQKLKNNPQDTAMISAVIALGKTFGLEVVAEGVETYEQLEILQALGCEIMQGYRFSQPMNFRDTTQFLSLHHTLSVENDDFSETLIADITPQFTQ